LVFKRRDRRPIWKVVADFFYPRGGWARAFEYVKHRVRRLPDTPEKISRGIWAGVFVCFTPFFGLHFLGAAIIAKLMRGNFLAALMSTFFGNPITFPAIAWISLEVGSRVLGTPRIRGQEKGLGGKFADAWGDLWHNFKAIFSTEKMDWSGLNVFYAEVFYPYLIGGIVPGIICATIAYVLCVPLITAYQNRRRKKLREKLGKLKNRSLS